MPDDNRIDLHERIKAIEVELEHIEEDGKARSEEIAAIRTDVAAVAKELTTLNTELARYRGVVGGILLIATALVSFFKLFWDDIVKFFKATS